MGPVRVPAGSGYAYVRPDESADFDVYDEVIRDRAYSHDFGNPLTIIDAGAHIGLTSVFMAQRYPKALIVAVEPQDGNFAMLERHAKVYPNIKPVKAGLWSKETRLRVIDPDVDSWSFRVEEDPDGFQAVTVESLMRRFGMERVDLLKIDIEGSEVEVLDHSAGWINKVGALVVETHERFKPGSEESVRRATRTRNWKHERCGINEVFLPA
jgi:FkbM family methyltransferase